MILQVYIYSHRGQVVSRNRSKFISNFAHSRTQIRHIPIHDTCNTFEFDAPEWTLYWKSPFARKKETKWCYDLHASIFKDKAVKVIVYPNKTTVNTGCTRSTPQCRGP